MAGGKAGGVGEIQEGLQQAQSMPLLALNKETRSILLSPIRQEKPPPLPDPARHNEMLAGYTQAIPSVAEKRS